VIAVAPTGREDAGMAPRVRLTAFDAGPFILDRGALMVGLSGPLTVPSTVAVVEHEQHGLVLVDTGVNYRVADPDLAERHWGPGLRERYGATEFAREQAVDAQLERLGYRCDDVSHVIYTHLHLDHAGGMEHFPNAVHVAQHDELRHAWWPDRWTARGYALADYLPGRGFDYLELAGDADLFGDGSMRVVRLAGHTPGSQGLVVDLPHRGRVAFVGDAAHLREQITADVPQFSDWNVEAKLLSYQRLRALQRSGIDVFLAHDVEDFGALPTAGTYWD
jgi:glyoxylase-like metal-dependent hydrolase (beta-lactamase superfamily II)